MTDENTLKDKLESLISAKCKIIHLMNSQTVDHDVMYPPGSQVSNLGVHKMTYSGALTGGTKGEG